MKKSMINDCRNIWFNEFDNRKIVIIKFDRNDNNIIYQNNV